MKADFNEWANNIDIEIASRESELAAQRSEFVERRKLITSHSPSLWEDLQESFKAGCVAFNERGGRITLVPHLAGPNSFIIKRDGGVETLAVTRNPSTHAVTISSVKYDPTVIDIGDGKVVYLSNNQHFSCEEMAKQSLKNFILSCRR